MGIAVLDIESRSRSYYAGATCTAIALVFFFGVGLAGGAAYKIYLGADAGPQLAEGATSPPSAASPPPAQNLAAEQAAPDLARIEPSAPPALAPPPAPTPAEATKPHAPSARVAQAAPAEPPAPATEAANPNRAAAVPPKKPEKPAMVAKAHRPGPTKITGPAQAVALRAPPAAPGSAGGAFRVQFGAFANEDNARRVQWAVEATGVKVDVSREPGPSGHPLFFLRSQSYPDHASALRAAQTVQHRVQGFVNAIPIDYAILGDRSAPEQQAQR